MSALGNLEITTATIGQMLDKINDGIERLDTLTHDDDALDVSQANVVTLTVTGPFDFEGRVTNTYVTSTFAQNTFVTANYVANSDFSNTDILNKLLGVDGDGSGLDADLLDGLESGQFTQNTYVTSTFAQNTFVTANYVANSDFLDIDILNKILNVDGAGSGLDADLLDGFQASDFLQGSNNLSDVNDAATARSNLGISDTSNSAIKFVFDGGGEKIKNGAQGDLEVPFTCTINRVTLLADQTGNVVIDVWRDTYANYPPTDGDSITASAVPSISSAQSSQDDTLSGWTTSINAGDILRFNVDSANVVTRCTISLKVTI